MARPRQPIDLIVLKGKKNLTKSEIEERKSTEIKAPADKVRPPAYLPKELKREFKKIADELMRIDIFSNLDIDALARFLFARKMYVELTEKLLVTPPIQEQKGFDDYGNEVTNIDTNPVYDQLLINQDKVFKQCRAAASDLGLTITSRVKLVIPKKEEEGPKSEGERRFGDLL